MERSRSYQENPSCAQSKESIPSELADSLSVILQLNIRITLRNRSMAVILRDFVSLGGFCALRSDPECVKVS